MLLAAGSGITPMRALLQAAAQAGMPMDVDLLYWLLQRGNVVQRIGVHAFCRSLAFAGGQQLHTQARMRRGQRGEFVDEAGFVALAHPTT